MKEYIKSQSLDKRADKNNKLDEINQIKIESEKPSEDLTVPENNLIEDSSAEQVEVKNSNKESKISIKDLELSKNNENDELVDRKDLEISDIKSIEKDEEFRDRIRKKVYLNFLAERVKKEIKVEKSSESGENLWGVVLEKMSEGNPEEALNLYEISRANSKYDRAHFLEENKLTFLEDDNLKRKYIELLKKEVESGHGDIFLKELFEVLTTEGKQEELFEFIKNVNQIKGNSDRYYSRLLQAVGIKIYGRSTEESLADLNNLLPIDESTVNYAIQAYNKDINIDELLKIISQKKNHLSTKEDILKSNELLGEYIKVNTSYIVLMLKKYQKDPDSFSDNIKKIEEICVKLPQYYDYVSECYAEMGLLQDSLRTAKAYEISYDKENNDGKKNIYSYTAPAILYAKIAVFYGKQGEDYLPAMEKSQQLMESIPKEIFKKGWQDFSNYIRSSCIIASYQKEVGDKNFIETIRKTTSMIKGENYLNHFDFIYRNSSSPSSTLENAFYLLLDQKDGSEPTADLLKEINRLYGYGMRVEWNNHEFTKPEEFSIYLSLLKKIRESFPEQEPLVQESINGILSNFKKGIDSYNSNEKYNCQKLLLAIAEETKQFDNSLFNGLKEIADEFYKETKKETKNPDSLYYINNALNLEKEYDIKIDSDKILKIAENIAKGTKVGFMSSIPIDNIASVICENYGIKRCEKFIESFQYDEYWREKSYLKNTGKLLIKKGKADGIELINKTGKGIEVENKYKIIKEIRKDNKISYDEKKAIFLDSIIYKNVELWREIGSITNSDEQKILLQNAPESLREEINDNFILSSSYFGKIDESEKPRLIDNYGGKIENLIKQESSVKNLKVNKNIGLYTNILVNMGTDQSLKVLEQIVQSNVDKHTTSEHVRIILKHLIEAGTDSSAEIAVNLLKEQRSDAELVHYLVRKLGEKDLLFKFNNLNSEYARNLINEKLTDEVLDNLEKFEKLDEDLAFELSKTNSRLVDRYMNKFIVTDDTKKAMKSYGIKLSEYVSIRDGLKDAEKNMDSETTFSFIFDNLKRNHEYWKDEQNVSNPFKTGVEIFGFKNMFKYLDREGLSRHDGLHNFAKISELAVASGLEPKVFYNNILEQVLRDDAEYRDGTAHHHLNNIASNISFDFEALKTKAAEYADVEKLADLVKTLEKPDDIFASWKNLKKYEELSRLLEKADILKQLQELKNSGNDKLYHYVENLAFHPNISMEKVFQLWRNPRAFLEIDDSHTTQEVHDRKKPSNYVEFPNLDLSAEELRDALVDGTYDKLQVFKPLVIEYQLTNASAEKLTQSLSSEVTRALGKRKEGIKGEAKNAPKLFKELQNILKAEKISLNDFLAGKVELSESVASTVREKLYDGDIGLQLKQKDIEEYRAKINLKSDPNGVVAGNDTACCMPFGSGKNNVYTFNPNCVLFTLQKKNFDKTWRTIAQSVLTKDVNIKKNVSGVVQAMRDETHLNDVIPDEILHQQQSVIACDNIEVSPNFKGNDTTISAIYRDFFNEYIKKYGKEDNFDNTKVVIGQGYTDAMTNLPNAENTFVPRAPVGYSDKLGKSVYLLALGENQPKSTIIDLPIFSREVKTDTVLEQEKQVSEFDLPKGVSELTFEDSLPVAYIEGKAYKDNKNLIEYLHNMENALIAKDVNNEAKHRPNMSFKYEDNEGKMHGYILAYEGKVDKKNENVVYVSDLASDGNQRAGGSLILGFTEAYKYNYIDKDNLISIYAQMREKTSYAIITKQLEKLSAGTGIKFEIKELKSYEVGGDTMHQVLIKPIKS